jgi:hypothetical protein
MSCSPVALFSPATAQLRGLFRMALSNAAAPGVMLDPTNKRAITTKGKAHYHMSVFR